MSVEAYKKIFRQADTDGSGQLSLDELTNLLKKHGYPTHKIRDMFISVDTSNDNQISESEFLSMMGCQPPETHENAQNRNHMMQVFRMFDKNGDGKVSKSELTQVFKEMGKVLPEAHINRMMELKDKDGNETLDYEEFIEAVMR